jgi:hypothetical protein
MEQIEKREQLIVLADLATQMESLIKILGDENLVRWLNSQYDPSGQKADYTQWLAKQFKKIGGLPENIKELLAEFDRLKKISALKGKFSPDIGSYKTIEDVRKAIAPYQGFESKKQQKKKQVEGVMMTLSNYGEVTYGSHGYLLLYVDDAEKVSVFLHVLGINSWCIRHKDMAEDYVPITFLIKNGKVVANLAGSDGIVYDRNDDHSSVPEHYEVLLENGSDIVFEDGELYESFPVKMQMKVRAFCAKDAERAQMFATYILRDMFPEGEEAISKDAGSSFLYARNALGGRFQAGEKTIIEDGGYVADYAVNIMKGRWPVAEKKILESPHTALKYARFCIKGEWVEGEPIIATDASMAVLYAVHILDGPFPKAEATIAEDNYNSYYYAKEILKHRFPEGEPALLAKGGNNAVSYAFDVIEDRWPELEVRLIEDMPGQETYESRRYANYFSLYYNEELKKFISVNHIEPDTFKKEDDIQPPPLLQQTPESLARIGYPTEASFRPLESMIMMADLESQMSALLKIVSDEGLVRAININHDPTGTKADYTQWLVKQYKKNGPLPGTIGLMLKEFDRLKKIPSLKGKLNPDINSYVSPEALRAALSQFTGTKSKKEERRTRVNGVMMNLSKFGEKVTYTKSKDGASYILLECADSSNVAEFLETLDIDSWCIRDCDLAKRYVPIVFLIRNGSVVGNLAEDGVIYDRQDESSDEPEHYSVLLRNGYQPTDMDKSLFEMLPEDIQEIVRKQALTSPQGVYNYACNIIDAPFPEGEEIIATYPGIACSYARFVLKGRFKAGEKGILVSDRKDGLLENYIINVLSISGERWPEAEPKILKNPNLAQIYAFYIIKGRWPEAEEIISRNSSVAYYYAKNVIKGRFPEGEAAIASNGWNASSYAREILDGPFPEGEPAIAKEADSSYGYAVDVLHARFELGEPAITRDYYYREKYCTIFKLDYDYEEFHPGSGKFVPRVEQSKEEILKSWGYSDEQIKEKLREIAEDEELKERFPSEEKTSSYRKLADLESQMPILLKMYHNGAWYGWSEGRLRAHIVDLIRDTDPTGDKATFARWIAKQDADRNRSAYSNDDIKHLLDRYDELRKTPKTKEKLSRDITSFDSFYELSKVLKEFEGIQSKKKERKGLVEGVMMNLDDYGDVKHVDDYTLIHMTDPYKVSDFLIKLQITSWCIKDVGYAKDYVPITFMLKDGKVEANLANDGRIYDRGDNTSTVSAHYSALLRGGFDVRYILSSTYSNLNSEDAKLLRNKVAKIPSAAYTFAMNILDGPFPEGEPAIATDPGFSYHYAHLVLHGRFPMGEPAIASHYSYSYSYAFYVVGGRWSEGEPAILRNSDAIIRYAENVIKGRWPEGEDALLHMGTPMDNLLDYAEKIIKGRWLEAEPLLVKVGSPWTLYWYAKNVIKGRWLEAEHRIGFAHDAAGRYAEDFGLSMFTYDGYHFEFKEIENVGENSELS